MGRRLSMASTTAKAALGVINGSGISDDDKVTLIALAAQSQTTMDMVAALVGHAHLDEVLRGIIRHSFLCRDELLIKREAHTHPLETYLVVAGGRVWHYLKCCGSNWTFKRLEVYAHSFLVISFLTFIAFER